MSEMYPKLDIWQRAQQLCLRLHKFTLALPSYERNHLFRKLRDNTELIPLKIAIGSTANTMKEYIKNLKSSYRLLIKVKTEVLISCYLEYISNEASNTLDNEINTLLTHVHHMIQHLEHQQGALNAAFAYSFPTYMTN